MGRDVRRMTAGTPPSSHARRHSGAPRLAAMGILRWNLAAAAGSGNAFQSARAPGVVPRRPGCSWMPAVWLALLVFAVRALLPTGFMPDPDALRAGRFQLVYCGAAGPMPAGMAQAGHFGAHPHMAHPGHPGATPTGHMERAAPAMSADGHGMRGQAPAIPDGDRMPADCPFGLTGVYTHAPPLPAVAAPVLALAWHIPRPVPTALPRAHVTPGPPLGSRAPPGLLD
ncbi:hypothetical protein BOBR111200_21070 [Bordetella bronchialis]